MIQKVRTHLTNGLTILVPELQATLGGGFHETQSSITFQPSTPFTNSDPSIHPDAQGFTILIDQRRTNFTQLRYTWIVNLARAGRTDALRVTGTFLDLRNPTEQYLDFFSSMSHGNFREDVKYRISLMVAYAVLLAEFKVRDLTENDRLEIATNLTEAQISNLISYFNAPIQTIYLSD